MRAGRFVIASTACASACALFNGSASTGDGGAAGACASADVPANPSLIGLGADQRTLLLNAAERGIVVVRYAGADCAVAFEVLADCRASGRYVYEADVERKDLIVPGEDELVSTLPIASVHLSGRLSGRGVRIDAHRVGSLRAPTSVRVDRGGLVGDECEDATHVVTKIGLGGYALTRAKTSELDDRGGQFSKAGAKASGTALVGDPEVCSRAARSGKRIDGCDQPLSSELVPITNELILSARLAIGGPGSTVEIDRFETTAGSYAACVATKKCTPAKTGPRCTAGVLGKEEHPINCVTWGQADAYCRSKNQRLPTEKEWAMGAGDSKFAWGDSWPPPEGAANLADAAARSRSPHWEVIDSYVDGFADTAPVGSLGASSDVMADAAGNVLEWTADWYDKRQRARVVRGSSYGHAKKKEIASSFRSFYVPTTVSVHIGFRCIRD